MSDKLDVFIESQRETNRLTAEAMRTIAGAVSDLEKQAVDHNSFIRDSRWLVRSAALALILAGGGMVWQAIQPDNALTKADMQALVEELKKR